LYAQPAYAPALGAGLKRAKTTKSHQAVAAGG